MSCQRRGKLRRWTKRNDMETIQPDPRPPEPLPTNDAQRTEETNGGAAPKIVPPPPGAPPPQPPADERLRTLSTFHRVMGRPESASIAGAVLVFVVFALSASDSGMFALDGVINWATVSAYLGIVATGACLLMIAGEFDLSLGSMIGFTGMMAAIPPLFYGWPVWLAMLVSLVCALLLGFVNGQLVVRTGLPSFIVTLAFLFVLRGLTLAFSVIVADRTIVSGIGDLADRDPVAGLLFSGTFGDGLLGWLAHHHWIRTLDD